MKLTYFLPITALVVLTGLAAHAQTWNPQTIATANLIDDIWIVDDLNGWLVGDAGTSFRTTDGGTTWTPFFLTGDDLGGVAFADAQIGLIVGDNGRIFRTVDGGALWAPVASGTANNLASVAFGSGGAAYIVGRDATILRSSDSGASWTVVQTGADRYRNVWAVGPTHAWLVGDEGVIRATVDAGVTWNDQNPGTASDFKGVFFLDQTEGWAAGQNSTLLHTSDGGAIWTPRSAGIQVGLNMAFFTDALTGWAVGNAGAIYHTVNGGLSWLPEASGTINELRDVMFVGASRGWTAGDLGTVLFREDVTPVGDGNAALPQAPSILGNVPNPFNPTTEIRFRLPVAADVILAIHDAAGRRIRELRPGSLPAGIHGVAWNGTDRAGRPVGSGTYLVSLNAGDHVSTHKIALAK